MMAAKLMTGAFTALVTPFADDGSIDEAAFRALVEWQITEGIDGLVPCGSTGEAATMSLDERVRVVRICVEQAAGRVPVIAGAGGNDTRLAIATSKAMTDAGATHLLHVSPAYTKPPQRGLIAHFRAIADAAARPVMLYNVPGRTASNMLPETTLALAEHPNIFAMKEACGDMKQIAQVIKGAPAGFTVLSGDDNLTCDVIAAGGQGVVSVVSNAIPRAMAQLCKDKPTMTPPSLAPLMADAFIESNPLPIKAALSMLGKIRNNLRLPLVPMDPKHDARVRAALVSAGALSS
jgi:4-hydroxy-tetrahydrodipicolinate synthase